MLLVDFGLFELENADESCQFKHVLDVVVHATHHDMAACGFGTF
jgi:hypothetical protein